MTDRDSSAHRDDGLYRILRKPATFGGLQRLLGGPRAIRRFVDELLKPAQGDAILDVGCGLGSLLEALPTGIRYVGYDINPQYIEVARLRHGERGRFYCASAGDEPAEIRQMTFDLVVAVALLHHLTDAEADRLLRTAARLLSPGGAFVSLDPVLHDGQSWVSRAAAKWDRGGMVRSPAGYQRLVAPHFAAVHERLLTDMLVIPYSHLVMRASRPN